jgi:cell division protein FtsN
VLAPDGRPADEPPAAVAPEPAPPPIPHPGSPARGGCPGNAGARSRPDARAARRGGAVAGSAVAGGAFAGDAAPPSAAAPSASSDPEAPYRVSVGAFGSAENAERQAATFRAAGFPVFTGTQGNLTIVLVGPYESEADALAVATRIRGGDFGIDPVVYRFQPDALVGGRRDARARGPGRSCGRSDPSGRSGARAGPGSGTRSRPCRGR